jgi:hypothetical protein
VSTGTGVHLCGPLVVRIDGRTVESEYLIPARDQLGAQRWDEIAARGARLTRGFGHAPCSDPAVSPP